MQEIRPGRRTRCAGAWNALVMCRIKREPFGPRESRRGGEGGLGKAEWRPGADDEACLVAGAGRAEGSTRVCAFVPDEGNLENRAI